MKKSVKKVLAIIMTVALVITGTSMFCFAATTQGTDDAIGDAVSQWLTALSSYQWTDFYAMISAILHAFGFTGNFDGFTSMAALADEWFSMLGGLGTFFDTFINNIDTSGLLSLLNKILASSGK